MLIKEVEGGSMLTGRCVLLSVAAVHSNLQNRNDTSEVFVFSRHRDVASPAYGCIANSHALSRQRKARS